MTIRAGLPQRVTPGFSFALAEQIERQAEQDGVDPQELVRELFLRPLPEFVAYALGDALAHLRADRPTEGVDSS